MTVETTCGREVERVPCRSYTGVSEFQEEVLRVLLLRKESQHWEPVTISLRFGDFVHRELEVS